MKEFLAQYGILIVIALGGLWILTKGRRHLETVKSDAKDALLKAALKEMGIDKLPNTEKIEKMAKLVSAVKSATPAGVAGKAIDVLAEELAGIKDRGLPDPVDETNDIDGLGKALNKAIKAETKREKAKRGFKKVGAIGLKILKGLVS